MLLRTRVTVIAALACALAVAGLAVAGLDSEHLADQRTAEATLTGQEAFWNQLVENSLLRLRAAAPAFAGHPDLIAAVGRSDPAQVREAMAPVAAALAQHPRLSRWEVVDGGGGLLTSSAGSLLDAPMLGADTVRLVVATGRPHDGIIQQPDGAFAVAATVPLAGASGPAAGVAILAADLRPLLAEFKAATGSDIFLLDRGGRVVVGTEPGLAKDLAGLQPVRHGRMEAWTAGGRALALALRPLHDADGREIGTVATAEDATRPQQQREAIHRVALGSVAAFLALVLLGIHAHLRRSLRPLDEAVRVLDALARGDTSVRPHTVDDGDEVGRLAAAVGAFRNHAAELEQVERRRERQRRRQELFIRVQMQALAQTLEGGAPAAIATDLADMEARSRGGGDDSGEMEVLAKAFRTLADGIREQQHQLQARIAGRGRDVEILQEALRTRDHLAALSQEAEFARELQLSSLPRVFPPFPDRDEFMIHAAMVPAKEVGGDFYDFFLVDHHHLGVAIGDASGKGVPAAMFTAITRSLIKSVAPLAHSPAECMAFVNTMLSADNPRRLLVTAFYGVLDLRTGEVAFCSAGHPPPLLLRADGRVEVVRGESGVALGVTDDFDYQTGHAAVGPGDTMLLYTDGVTAATDGHGAPFEEGRLARVLGTLSGLEPADVIARVGLAVEKFVGDAPQSDDITLLSWRFVHPAHDAAAELEPPPPTPADQELPAPPPEPPPPAPPRVLAAPVVQLTPVARPPRPAPDAAPGLAVTIVNDLAELNRLAEAVEAFVARNGLPERMAFNLNLCLDELITGTVSHGYGDGGRHEILVRLGIEGGALVTTIVDDAAPFDPFAEAPAAGAGGLGAVLVKDFNDACAYRRDGDRNIVTISKAIDRDG